MPSKCSAATSWRRRGGWASARPPCIANSKNTALRSRPRKPAASTRSIFTDGRRLPAERGVMPGQGGGKEQGIAMILLVTTSSRGREYAAALERGTGHKTHVAGSVPQAVAKLQAVEYELLATDQSLL